MDLDAGRAWSSQTLGSQDNGYWTEGLESPSGGVSITGLMESQCLEKVCKRTTIATSTGTIYLAAHGGKCGQATYYGLWVQH